MEVGTIYLLAVIAVAVVARLIVTVWVIEAWTLRHILRLLFHLADKFTARDNGSGRSRS